MCPSHIERPKLGEIGIHETEDNLYNRVSGGFPAVRFVQVLTVTGCHSVRLHEGS